MTERFETDIRAVGAGGAGIGRHPDGRSAFVAGAAPGDRVIAEIDRAKKRFLHATAVEIVEASADRVEPPCPSVAEGCGGCDWQHLEPAAQSKLRVGIVRDALERIGGLRDAVEPQAAGRNADFASGPDAADPRESGVREPGVRVSAGPTLDPFGYRTTVRAVVNADGRAGFRARRAHRPVVPDTCLTAHPQLAELMATCRFDGVREATFRLGARTGERLILLDSNEGIVDAPEDVIVARPGDDACHHEVIAGHRFRISAASFFQCRPDGADALVDMVDEALCPNGGDRQNLAHDGRRLLDAYGGVGLFGATVARGAHVIGVESSPSSHADAQVNLPDSADLYRSRFERWTPQPVDLAVVDPARSGLEAEGAAVLVACEPEVIALVSCDPGALGRDARLLIDAGYRLDWVRTLDLFGSTSHVEVVSRFVRS